MGCIFCKIRDGEAPSYKVYEDQRTLAFLDVNPVADGHVLLIPRLHVRYIEELPEPDAEALMKTLIKIVPPIQRALNATDSNIAINNGPNAGQIIPHVHIHIIPRPSKAGGLLFTNASRFRPRSEKYYEEMAEKIRSEIDATLSNRGKAKQ